MNNGTAMAQANLDEAKKKHLEIQNVSISRSGRPVLNNIDLTLRSGDVAILRGDNGAGKTTLLRALAGFVPIDSGKIRLRSSKPEIAGVEHRGDVVFFGHCDAVKGALTGQENLHFWAQLYGAGPRSGGAAAEKLALSPILDRPANMLSAGQRRRLGLCRVLISRKPVWLLDEPTASMDDGAVKLVLGLVTEHTGGGGIALIATHDQIGITNARDIFLSAPAAKENAA